MRLPSFWSQTISSLLLSLLLALLVWVVATNIELVQLTFPTQGQGIPIELINQPPGLVVTEGAEQTIRAQLRIPQELRSDLQTSDLVVEADLAGLGPGVHQVPVIVRSQPYAPPFRLLSPEPDRIIVRLDELITRTLPIEVVIPDLTSIPPTYQVLTTTVSPPTVTIAGPRTIVAPLEQVIAEAEISGARETVTRLVRPDLLGIGTGPGRSLVDLSSEQLTVTLDIDLRPGYRDLIVSTDIQGEPASGYWVSGIAPEPRLVTVVGQPDLISALDGIVATEPIDVEGLGEGQFSRTTPLRLPEGVSPLNEGVVQVRIQIEPQTSSKRVTLTPIVTGLQPGQSVPPDEISPATVNVLLKGPVTELESLNLDDLVATLDVTDRPLGSHLITPRVQTPGTLIAESINPDLVEVTIVEETLSRQVRVPVAVRGVASRLAAVVEPATLGLTVTGPTSLVTPLVPEAIGATVDVRGLEAGAYELVPTLALSDRLTVTMPITPVLVNLYDQSDLLQLTEPVSLSNLPPGLSATLSQPVVRVRVAGPGDAETLAQRAEFAVELDVSGLGEGIYSLTPRVRLPEGYSLVSADPPAIEVRLRAGS